MRLPVLQFFTASFHLRSPLSAVQAEGLEDEVISNKVVTYTAGKPSLDSRSVGYVGTPQQFNLLKPTGYVMHQPV